MNKYTYELVFQFKLFPNKNKLLSCTCVKIEIVNLIGQNDANDKIK